MNVTDPEHPSAVLRELNSLRKEAELTDVVLEVEGKSFPCHRAVLASCSPYFRAMFTSSYAEARQDRITIRDVSEVAMATILDYAYTGCLETEEDQVQAVMSAAGLLQVGFVCRQAAEYMKEHLDVSNCADVLMYADMQGDSDLVEDSERYIASRFNEAVLQPSFLQLSLSQLQSLLESDDLITQSEDDVVQAALRWIDFNQSERSQHLPALCKTLHQPFISSKQREEMESRHLSSSGGTLVYSENTTQRLGQKRTEMQIILKCYFDDIDGHPYVPCYNPATGAAYAIDLPKGIPRDYSMLSMAATPDGDLYLATDIDTSGQESRTNRERKFYLYNHLLATWEPKREMIAKTAWYELVFLKGYIYAIGRDNEKGMAERYDPSRDEWTSIPPFPYPVSWPLYAVALGNNIYVMRKEGCCSFSTTENRWDKIADMVEPPKFLQAVTYRGSIYCVNREFSVYRDSLPTYVEAYNPADGVWKRTGNGKSFVYNNGIPTTYGGTLQATLMTHRETLYLFTVHIVRGCRRFWEERNPQSKLYVYEYQPETDSWVSVGKAAKRRLVPPKRCHDSLTEFRVARMFPSWLGYNSDLEDLM
ncbi:PREDICTED: kelch repeat and BTB domain-containing protein 8-like [Branchiostoma belcheri]|uniref:Kelch repeat and BTB domain-containing protein 8-like n=1 Tax=Branchiostoma belcheri TaxID=7741 RepID=A0A6P4XTI5_BRABE|nr:PREDICTED: kelch repeat and BTB domain-containing protein 8-like [Branchiostoma belcheri]